MIEAIAGRLRDSRPIAWVIVAALCGAAAGGLAYAAFAGTGVARLTLAGMGGLFAACVMYTIAVRPWFGVIAMLAVLPLDTAGRLLEQPVALTVFHLVLFFSLASWVAHLALRRESLRMSVVDVGLGLLVLAAMWSLPRSLNTSATMLGVIRLSFLWVFELFVANQLRTERRTAAALWALLGTGAIMGAFAFAQAYVPGFDFGNVHAQGPVGDQLLRPAAFFDDPNYLAGFLSCAVIVAAAYVVHARRWAPALLATALGAAAGAGALVTYSRTAWLGIVVGLALVAMTAPRKRRIRVVLAGLICVLLLGAFAVVRGGAFIERAESTADVSGDSSVSTRVLMLRSTVEMIQDDWVYGSGLGAFDRRYLQYRQTGSLLDILRPHQVPLALWAEMGVVGLIAQIALLAGLGILSWKPRRHERTAAEAIALAGLASLFTQSLFQYYVYFEYVWLFFALAVAVSRTATRSKEGS